MSNYCIICADVMDGLASLAGDSVDLVATSPPYWGLRDYGTGAWDGGDSACDHLEKTGGTGKSSLGKTSWGNGMSDEALERSTMRSFVPYREVCGKCGARRIDKQLGLEPTIAAYVENTVRWAREIRRVLKPTGVFFLNLGDSYYGDSPVRQTSAEAWSETWDPSQTRSRGGKRRTAACDGALKPKDLCGVPWRVVLALQADGWWWRSVIPWLKRNSMPESCRDRPSTNTEWVFMLTKSAHYFWDAEAIRVPRIYDEKRTTRKQYDGKAENTSTFMPGNPSGRNRRNGDWWYESYAALMTGGALGPVMDGDEIVALDVNPESYREAHFATFPTRLVRPFILAGTSERGCCPTCGAPWVRVVETERTFESGSGRAGNLPTGKNGVNMQGGGETIDVRRGPVVHNRTVGWRPTCACPAHEPVPCTVLDPFLGSGTTVAEAVRLGRRGIGIELNPGYVALSERRIGKVSGVEETVAPDGTRVRQDSLFDAQTADSR